MPAQGNRILNLVLKLGLDQQGLNQVLNQLKRVNQQVQGSLNQQLSGRLQGSPTNVGPGSASQQGWLSQALYAGSLRSATTGQAGQSFFQAFTRQAAQTGQQLQQVGVQAQATATTAGQVIKSIVQSVTQNVQSSIDQAIARLRVLANQGGITQNRLNQALGIGGGGAGGPGGTGGTGLTLGNFWKNLTGPKDPFAKQREVNPADISRSMAKVWQMGIAGFTLSMSGSALMKSTQGLFKLVEKYMTFVGQTNTLGAQWAKTNKDIENSLMRIGAVFANSLIPAFKEAASYLNRIAGYLEQNPEIAAKLGKGAVAAAAVGGTALVTGQIMSAFATLTNIIILMKQAITGSGILKLGMGAAIKTEKAKLAKDATQAQIADAIAKAVPTSAQVMAAALGVAASTVLGAVVGAFLYEQLRPMLEDITGKHFASLAEYSVVFLTGILKLIELPMKATTGLILLLQGKFVEFFEMLLRLLSPGGEELSLGSQNLIKEWDKIVGATEKAAESEKRLREARERTANQTKIVSDQQAQAMMQYRQQIADLETQTGEKRKDIADKYLEDLAQLEAEWGETRAQIAADLSKAIREETKSYDKDVLDLTTEYQDKETQEYEDYFKARNETLKDANDDIQKLEADHQRRLKEMLQNHQLRVWELVANQDALGLVQELRKFNLETQQENDRFAAELAERKVEQAKRLDELRAEFEEQRAERADDFSKQLEEMKVQHEEKIKELKVEAKEREAEELKAYQKSLDALKKAKADELRALQKSYDDQMTLLRRNFIDRIRALDATVLADYEAYLAKLKQYSQDFQAWVKDPANFKLPETGTAGSTSRDAGGYVYPGQMYRIGRGPEFVLDPQTTRAAQSFAGGRLTQSNLLARLTAGGGGTFNIHAAVSVTGALTEEEHMRTMRETRQAISEGILTALGAT